MGGNGDGAGGSVMDVWDMDANGYGASGCRAGADRLGRRRVMRKEQGKWVH